MASKKRKAETQADVDVDMKPQSKDEYYSLRKTPNYVQLLSNSKRDSPNSEEDLEKFLGKYINMTRLLYELLKFDELKIYEEDLRVKKQLRNTMK